MNLGNEVTCVVVLAGIENIFGDGRELRRVNDANDLVSTISPKLGEP